VAQSRASPSQQIDETGWRENGQNGYIWAQATDGPLATRTFTYDHSRAGAVADRLLAGYEGVVVSDGYVAYDHLACPKQRCWAHLRRAAHKLAEHIRTIGPCAPGSTGSRACTRGPAGWRRIIA